MFRPEEPAEERKLFRWDFGSPEAVPLRSSIDCLSRCKKRLHRKDSGEILHDSGEKPKPPERQQEPLEATRRSSAVKIVVPVDFG